MTDVNPALLNRFIFSYNLSGASIGALASINYTQSNNGTNTVLRVINYSYYTSNGTNGPIGALQRDF